MIPYTTDVLPNGLRVLVHSDPTVAKAAVNLCYRVGSKHEAPGRTGLAHLFEHLMFEGSVHIPHYDVPVQRVGGQNNAFTSADVTNYYITLPSSQLETAFWLESDRMLGLAFSDEKLRIQKSVVIEEFKQRYLNQPYGDAYLHLRPVMFEQHPYQWMTIGKSTEHVEHASMEEIQQFFYSHYAPNNATLVVAGGVTRSQVLQLAEKWFGPIPERQLDSRPRGPEPQQTAPRHVEVERPVPQTYIYKAYHGPARLDDAYYPTDLITDLLSSGKASRLYQRLVKELKLCTGASAFSWGLHDTGKFSINAQLAPGVTPAAFDEALEALLCELDEVPQAELDRQLTKIEAMEAFQKTQVANKAMALALSDAAGDAERVNTDLKRYKSLTPSDVRAARQAVFVPQNCTTLVYRAA